MVTLYASKSICQVLCQHFSREDLNRRKHECGQLLKCFSPWRPVVFYLTNLSRLDQNNYGGSPVAHFTRSLWAHNKYFVKVRVALAYELFIYSSCSLAHATADELSCFVQMVYLINWRTVKTLQNATFMGIVNGPWFHQCLWRSSGAVINRCKQHC